MRSAFYLSAALLLVPATSFAQEEEAKPETPPPAAQPEEPEVSDADKARATALFNEAKALLEAGEIGAACAKFEESYKVRPGIGTLYNHADCREKNGQTGTAYKLFEEVVVRTQAALQSEREEKAKARLKELTPRLMKIRLSVPQGGKVSSVKVDGQVIKAEEYNKALVYDPGEHTVEASTSKDEGEPFTEDIELTEEGKTVTIAIPIAPGAKMKPRVGMIIGGGITMGVGALALTGAVIIAAGGDGDGESAPAAIGLGVLGLVGLGVGIPIFAVGFKKRPVREGFLDVPIEPSPIPQIAIGPTGGTLTWEF